MKPNLDDPILANRLALLTKREREVLDLVLDGQISQEIAIRLGIAQSTVANYRNRINRKLGDYGWRALGL